MRRIYLNEKDLFKFFSLFIRNSIYREVKNSLYAIWNLNATLGEFKFLFRES